MECDKVALKAEELWLWDLLDNEYGQMQSGAAATLPNRITFRYLTTYA